MIELCSTESNALEKSRKSAILVSFWLRVFLILATIFSRLSCVEFIDRKPCWDFSIVALLNGVILVFNKLVIVFRTCGRSDIGLKFVCNSEVPFLWSHMTSPLLIAFGSVPVLQKS